MNEQARNVIIGVFVLAATCLVVWLVLFLHPTVGDEQKILRVRFTNIEKVSIGTRVTFAGKPVGQVIAINQIFDARQKAQPETERVYFFELVLAVDSSIQVFNTDQIVLHTLGLFGEKSIAIIPRNPPLGVVPVEITDQVIYAKSGDQMQDVFSEFTSVATKAGRAFDQLSTLLDEKQGGLTLALHAAKKSLDAVGDTFIEINDLQLVSSIKEASEQLSNAMNSFDQALIELAAEDFWKDLDNTVNQVGEFAQKGVQPLLDLGVVAKEISQGRGTLGKLVKDDELYFRTLSLLNQGNDLLNSVNHYGLLFNFNKRWQRQQRHPYLSSTSSYASMQHKVNKMSENVEQIQVLLQDKEAKGNPILLRQNYTHITTQLRCLEERMRQLNTELADAQRAG